jgi:hypothetical protein
LFYFYEAGKATPGDRLSITYLARILLAELLRAFVATEAHHDGWLGARVDAKIGAALAIMHRDVPKRLTVDHIASAVGMSRSPSASIISGSRAGATSGIDRDQQ